MTSIRNAWDSSETWHILGNSQSLMDESGVDDLHPSIGVNRILRTHCPDHVLMADPKVFQQEIERLQNYQGIIILYWRVACRLPAERIKLGEHRSIRAKEGLYARPGNTAGYAIEYAARKIWSGPGQGTIILHGIDFATRKGRPTHSYGNGAKEGAHATHWPEHLDFLRGSVRFLKESGIDVKNASPWHGPLDRFVERLDGRTNPKLR